MGGRQARRCARTLIVVPAALRRLRRGQQGGVRDLRATPRRSSKASRSTRRSSTSADCSGSSGHAARDRRQAAPRRARPGRPGDHGRGRADEVPGQGRQRGRQAGRAAGRAGRRRARVPASAAGRAAVGRRPGDRREAARARHTTVRRRRRAARRTALVAMLGRASGRHLHALAHNRDPRPVRVGVRRRSIGSQRALGRRRLSLDDLDAALVGLVDRVCRRLRKADRVCRTVVLRLRFDDFTRATRSHTLARPSDDTDGHPGHRAGPARDRDAADPRRRLHAGRASRWPTSATATIRSSPSCRSARANSAGSTARSTVCASASARTAITRAVLLGRDPGMTVPMLPD